MSIASVTIAFIALSAAPDPIRPDPNFPRPIAAVDSVFIEDLTWMEVRDALKAGVDTVIVPTGGVEQNGPYLVTGKHNVVLRGTTEAIARKLGQTLVAPIVPFVPEGDIDPPSLHMLYPGTISVSEATFQVLLTDICSSLKTHGFQKIVLIGDSGGNQAGMKAVAAALSTKWKTTGCQIVFIPEYYSAASTDKFVTKWLESQGLKEVSEGLHDDFTMEATMLAIDPTSIRMQQRLPAGNFRINGIDLSPPEKTIAIGKQIIDVRAGTTVQAIQKALSR
ncbi:MAG TPA: creatininase family protein [Pirellulaceae bacterium]|jgi:creatinine amidohydrolase/Fe(II)-dependent formamide hydrolase-like protein